MRRTLLIFYAGLSFTIGIPAQTQDRLQVRIPPAGDSGQLVTLERTGSVAGHIGLHTEPYTMEFLSGEFEVAGKVVKNAPYTAEASTESIQTLADGNRIVRKSSAVLARDSEGRTRRDMTVGGFGALTAAHPEAPRVSFIHDPVTNSSVTLDHDSKIARRGAGRNFMVHFNAGPLPPPPSGSGASLGVAALPASSPRVMIERHEVTGSAVAAPSRHGAKTESLGKQTIEGVVAEGTRNTTTILAGEIGNDRPIEITTERWYSPELQMLIMTRHKDPMAGETTYRLTNLRRVEPAKTLFEAPADYKQMTMDAPRFEHRRTEKE